MLLVSCIGRSTYDDVVEYGEEKFIEEVLAVRDGHQISEEMKKEFNVIRAEAHLSGSWLVVKETNSYITGIYVDPEDVSAWGGSGMEVTPWSKQIGLSKEKKRK